MRNLFLVSVGFLLACSSTQTGEGEATGNTANTSATDGTNSGTTTTAGTNSTTGMTASGTGASAGSTSGVTSAGTASFVERPDGGEANECDPKAQDCPPDEKCAAWANDGGSSWNANKCVPVSGNGVDGDPCMVEGSGVSGLDDCDKGYMCWDVNEEAMGVCVAFCDEQENCPEGTLCAVQNDGVLPICIPGCNPLLQDCPDGSGCYAIDGEGGDVICIPDASGAGGMVGEPCEYDNVCDPGLICIGGPAGCMATWCCTPWCDLGEANTCPGAAQGEECVPHFQVAPPGLEDVGVCIIPN